MIFIKGGPDGLINSPVRRRSVLRPLQDPSSLPDADAGHQRSGGLNNTVESVMNALSQSKEFAASVSSSYY